MEVYLGFPSFSKSFISVGDCTFYPNFLQIIKVTDYGVLFQRTCNLIEIVDFRENFDLVKSPFVNW